jgi:hypothetical protein
LDTKIISKNIKKKNNEKYDYIEWEAYNGFLKRLREKLHDIRNGNFLMGQCSTP